MPQENKSKVEMLQKKKRAKALLLEQRLTQKAIAAQLGVTEKTMTAWVKKYGWNLSYEQGVEKDLSDKVTAPKGLIEVQGFADYLREKDPPFYRKGIGHLAAYLLTLANQ